VLKSTSIAIAYEKQPWLKQGTWAAVSVVCYKKSAESSA
jgi:hypothetical protein